VAETIQIDDSRVRWTVSADHDVGLVMVTLDFKDPDSDAVARVVFGLNESEGPKMREQIEACEREIARRKESRRG
jgi:hypothetical protein